VQHAGFDGGRSTASTRAPQIYASGADGLCKVVLPSDTT